MKNIERIRKDIDSRVVALIGIMALVVTVSNILVQYPWGNWLTLGALTYPFAFLVTDVANRNHGARIARVVVLGGFTAGIVCSMIASGYDLTTWRIALGSAIAFMTAQLLDIQLFARIRQEGGSWWRAPIISSTVGSVVDTVIFFFIAFSAITFLYLPDGNAWALESVPLLGFGPAVSLWVSLAVADLWVKLALLPILLIPYRWCIDLRKV